jgi:hypothetical protein
MFISHVNAVTLIPNIEKQFYLFAFEKDADIVATKSFAKLIIINFKVDVLTHYFNQIIIAFHFKVTTKRF